MYQIDFDDWPCYGVRKGKNDLCSIGGGRWENAISKREEVFEQMGMTLVCAIRKFGWPDSKGRWQYGNAAILCFLSHKNTGKQLVEQFKDVQVEDLISRYA